MQPLPHKQHSQTWMCKRRVTPGATPGSPVTTNDKSIDKENLMENCCGLKDLGPGGSPKHGSYFHLHLLSKKCLWEWFRPWKRIQSFRYPPRCLPGKKGLEQTLPERPGSCEITESKYLFWPLSHGPDLGHYFIHKSLDTRQLKTIFQKRSVTSGTSRCSQHC